MKKVAFCCLSHPAHIRHIVPIAVQFAKINGCKPDVIYTNIPAKKEIERVAGSKINDLKLIKLTPSLFKQVSGKLKSRLYPNIKSVLKKNESFLTKYDALVTPHHNLDFLIKNRERHNLKFICSFHGAGDNAIGFDSRFADYDLLLAPGKGICERLKKEGIAHDNNRVEVVGYPKHETLDDHRIPLFENQNPVFLYNPHYDEKLGSYPLFGKEIFQYFSQHQEFNLIVAPHVKLFGDKGFPKMLNSYSKYPNIHMDSGSERSIDGTYTRISDVYIGDISSQVYEFLYFGLKPVLFLNSAAKADFQWYSDPSFKMWQMGDVINTAKALNKAIESVAGRHQAYKSIQERFLAEKFYMPRQGASALAAQVIHSFVYGE